MGQDVLYVQNHGDQQRKLDLEVFGKMKTLDKLKLRSIGGSLKLDNFSSSLNLFAEKFSHSIRILVSPVDGTKTGSFLLMFLTELKRTPAFELNTNCILPF